MTNKKVCSFEKACGTSSSRERRELIDLASPFQLATKIVGTPLFIGKVH
jgi:hypothetical protein